MGSREREHEVGSQQGWHPKSARFCGGPGRGPGLGVQILGTVAAEEEPREKKVLGIEGSRQWQRQAQLSPSLALCYTWQCQGTRDRARALCMPAMHPL